MPTRDEMANRDDATRLRDLFPTTYALWLTIRGGSRRSARYMSESVSMPSAWTTAVLAGGLALSLSVVLLLVDPPPEASLSSAQQQGLLSPVAGEALPLEVAFVYGQFPAGWEERLEDLWVSQPVREVVQPSSLLAFDQWTASRTQPLTFATSESQNFDPYYLKAEFVDFDQLTAVVSADEVPSAGSSPVVQRGVALDVERGPALPSANGAVEYALHVRNTGYDAVDHVRVVETLPQVERVVDVVPPAAISPDGALVWELAAIGPQEERILTITLMPDSDTPLNTVAALDIESQFAVATLVRPAENVELFTPEPEPADLALPEMPAEDPAPVFTAEPIVSAPVEEPVILPDEPAAEPAATPSFDPFGSPPEAAPEAPVVPSWILEEDDGPPARTERPSTTLPPAEDPVVIEPEPVEPEIQLPAEPAAEEEGWSPTPRPVPLDSARSPQPLLHLKSRAPTSAATGDVVTTVFEISNSGDAPADEVLLTVHLAAGLKHKHGETVEHHIVQIGPGETRTATLYARAASTGLARIEAVLSHAGESDDEQSQTVRIGTPRGRPGQ